jgi:hypothetical protein
MARMWIAARATDAMATHAQRLAASAVTARASHRVAARFATMPVFGSTRADPICRMRARRRVSYLQQVLSCVAVATASLVRVTARTQARIDARFQTVAREKAGAVEISTPRLVEPQRDRERRHVHRVALRAFALCMTARAELARRSRRRPVTREKVARVHDVALRARAFRLESNMARGTRARSPLFSMLVTAQTTRHRWKQRAALRQHAFVATRAVTLGDAVMLSMRKRQVLLRLCRALAVLVVAMALATRSRVVRLGVTLQATGGRGQIERRNRIALGDASVTLNTGDPLSPVDSMGERFLRVLAQAEHARARGDEAQSREPRAGCGPAHGNTSLL